MNINFYHIEICRVWFVCYALISNHVKETIAFNSSSFKPRDGISFSQSIGNGRNSC